MQYYVMCVFVVPYKTTMKNYNFKFSFTSELSNLMIVFRDELTKNVCSIWKDLCQRYFVSSDSLFAN